MNSSSWDPLSADSSRRSSLAASDQGIAKQLDRLHRKAQAAQMSHEVSGRQSAMSDGPSSQQQQQQPGASAPNPALSSYGQPRRASDPGRALDRNFGLGGQMSRHKSYTHLAGTSIIHKRNIGHQVKDLYVTQMTGVEIVSVLTYSHS